MSWWTNTAELPVCHLVRGGVTFRQDRSRSHLRHPEVHTPLVHLPTLTGNDHTAVLSDSRTQSPDQRMESHMGNWWLKYICLHQCRHLFLLKTFLFHSLLKNKKNAPICLAIFQVISNKRSAAFFKDVSPAFILPFWIFTAPPL